MRFHDRCQWQMKVGKTLIEKALVLSRAVRESHDCGSAVRVRFKHPEVRNLRLLERVLGQGPNPK